METLHSMGITDAMITSTIITVIICVLAIIAGSNIQKIPTGWRNAVEMAIEKLYNFFEDVMGPESCRKYFPIIGTLFIYILICNYSGLLPGAGEVTGFKSPTSSVNFPLAMALIVFCMMQVAGIRENHGLKYYKHWFKPVAFIFPLMIIEEVVRPISLTFRLYGNIYGDETIVEVFNGIFPVGLSVIMQFLAVLMGLIQALVFSLLSAMYITEAAEADENEQLPVHTA